MIKYKILIALSFILFNSSYLEAERIVIKNATIYDGIDDSSYNGHILIENGLIKKLSKSSAIQGDIVIDVEGKIVTPGLIAPDTEIGIVEIGEQPFASMYYRKLDDPTFTPKEMLDEPLPF